MRIRGNFLGMPQARKSLPNSWKRFNFFWKCIFKKLHYIKKCLIKAENRRKTVILPYNDFETKQADGERNAEKRFFTRKIFVEIFLCAKILSLLKNFFIFFQKILYYRLTLRNQKSKKNGYNAVFFKFYQGFIIFSQNFNFFCP